MQFDCKLPGHFKHLNLSQWWVQQNKVQGDELTIYWGLLLPHTPLPVSHTPKQPLL